MSGWSLLAALVNFAILAGGLYLFGKKLVAKMLSDNRQHIIDGLRRAQECTERAGSLDAELERLRRETDERRQTLLREADETAERNARISGEKSRALEEGAKLAQRSEAEALKAQMLRELKAESAPTLLEQTGELIKGGGYDAAIAGLESRFAAEVEPLLRLTQADEACLQWGGRIDVTLYAASEAALRHEPELRRVAEDRLGAENIRFSSAVDPSAIGGFWLKVGDTVYDGSVYYMLRRLGESIAEDEDDIDDIGVYFTGKFSGADSSVGAFQNGRVISLAEGICRISGLSDVMAGEMVLIDSRLKGMVMDIGSEEISAVLLGGTESVHSGSIVRRTGRVVEVPVGEELIGRVVDGLGTPIDGKGRLNTGRTRPVESPAPSIISRRPVTVPLLTGIMAIDALVPIGRGQRELIIGDRQTGKTSIAVDTIINQKGKDVVCIYVAIGQKESTVAGIVEKLRQCGAMDYSIVVSANASDPAPMLYIAPYTGAAMGEYLMDKGRHVLIVYDDLSKHAVAYRELSLLLHRPPGREAYPGDVFFLHSRLLERAACLNEEHGGGSMTALPIVETQAGDISAYIPTNVISITDGQIFLDNDMFNAGDRPAINAGLSVSRVGGAAQPKAMKQFAARLRMDLAQHRELEAFAQFGSDLDKSTRDALNRGRKVTAMLVQPRYGPETVAEQVAAIFAVNNGYVDELDESLIAGFRVGLGRYLYLQDAELARYIDGGGKLSEEQTERLRAIIEQFKADFTAA